MASQASDNQNPSMDMLMLNTSIPADPFNQSFPLMAPDGSPIWLSTTLIYDVQNIVSLQSLLSGIQVGMTVMLLFAMIIMTKPDKKRSLVFAINLFALLCACMRSVLVAAQARTLFTNFYSFSVGYFPAGAAFHKAVSVSIGSEAFAFLLDCAIYGSLIMQVHIVCCTLVKPWRSLVIGSSVLVGIAACVVRLVLAILNCKYRVIGIVNTTEEQDAIVVRWASANNIVCICSIAFFAIIFNTKLLFAILARRKMNMKSFGPMQIILIMGCQTLIVPFVFSIIAYYVGEGAQLNAFTPALIAVFLPLSGMWASSHVNNKTEQGHRKHGVFPAGVSAVIGSSNKNQSTYTSNTIDTLINDDDVELGYSPAKQTTFVSTGERNPMQQVHKGGVTVDRTYSIRSE